MRIIQSDGGHNQTDIQDTNNCTIISIANAFKLPYHVADEIGIKSGRKRNRGFYIPELLKYIRRTTDLDFKRVQLKKPITIRRFIEQNPIGRFICCRRGHAFAVICGEIHDTCQRNTERQMIYSVHRILKTK
jgi:hypothetical protein